MNPYPGFNRPPVDILPAPSGSVPGVASNDDSPRRKRTRAKRSCDMCRKKKSKCDAELNRPCTNCKNWKTECVFLVEQKKRGPSTGHVFNHFAMSKYVINNHDQKKKINACVSIAIISKLVM